MGVAGGRHDVFFTPHCYGSFLCLQDRSSATQGAVSGVTWACDGRHSGPAPDGYRLSAIGAAVGRWYLALSIWSPAFGSQYLNLGLGVGSLSAGVILSAGVPPLHAGAEGPLPLANLARRTPETHYAQNSRNAAHTEAFLTMCHPERGAH